MKKIKLAIAIPSTGTIKSQTVFSLCRMLKDFPHDYTVLFHEGSMLHVMRDRLAQKAIDEKCTHLLFVDSDMTFEKDAVLGLLNRKKDIIGGKMHLRKNPPTLIMKNPHTNKELTTCDAIGTGFMLINLKVFKKLKQPWFFWDYVNGEPVGEDYWFCRLAREAGYKVWVDLSVPIKHIGDYAY